MRLRVGSGLPNIQIKEVSKYGLSLPIVEEQKKIAEMVMNQVQDLMLDHKISCFKGYKIRTTVWAAKTFYPAHLKHQEYLLKIVLE